MSFELRINEEGVNHVQKWKWHVLERGNSVCQGPGEVTGVGHSRKSQNSESGARIGVSQGDVGGHTVGGLLPTAGLCTVGRRGF